MKKFLSKFIFFLPVFLIIYVFYKSEIVHLGSKNEYYFKYYLISIILIFFSAFVFFLNEENKKKIFLIIFSVYITSLLFEILYYYNIQVNMHEAIKYTYLKKKNPDTFLKVYPSFFLKDENLDLFPLSGMSQKLIVGCKEENEVSTFNSDRFGFNNPDEEWSKSEIEVFMIGDSFVNGNCVNENYTISSNFRKFFNKKNSKNFSVINTGQPASGPLLQLSILREYLPKDKNIKKLIWFYYEQNDLENLNKELKNSILNKYFQNQNFTQNLMILNEEKDLIVKKYHDQKTKDIENFVRDNFGFTSLMQNIIKLRNVRRLTIENKETIKFINYLSGNKEKSKEIYFYPEKPNLNEFNFIADENLILKFEKIAQEIKTIAERNNIEPYFVYIPSLYRIQNNKNYKFIEKKKDKDITAADITFAYSKIKSIINNLGFYYIDLNSDFFSKTSNPEKFFTGSYRSHFTIEGYKKISIFISNNLNYD
jgi:hypothetical protein